MIATAYAYFILMPATLLLASVNSMNSIHIGSCLSVGYDTVKYVKYDDT